MLCSRWANAKCEREVSTHVLQHYRNALGMQHPDEVLYLYLVYIKCINGCYAYLLFQIYQLFICLLC